MITGAAATSVFYNLRLRHPTLELLIIDYDLALLFQPNKENVSIIENIKWKDLGILVIVWLIILALQIGKIPVAAGVTSYEAVSLYKGRRKITSMGEASNNWSVHELILYCFLGVMAGTVGGMLGLGGGVEQNITATLEPPVRSIGVEDQQDIEATLDTTVLKVGQLSDVYERCNLVHAEPTNYTKAAGVPTWIEAMKLEIDSIERNGT
ncbi:hypothetical protein POTOM_005026 [Populus tomentosa]|uniref:Uncharacterized protein n=1 Tax=Populus tomentosa TaxID=118781 RepID=A0A8X8AGK7_POPTO|nr:hypothetical protein POTOM_005026 [Populus tomentosa]